MNAKNHCHAIKNALSLGFQRRKRNPLNLVICKVRERNEAQYSPMQLTDEELQLIRLLVETSSLTGPELEDAWDLLRKVELFLWSEVDCMTTPNIEELRKLADAYAQHKYVNGAEGRGPDEPEQRTTFARQALMDALQSQAERIKELEAKMVPLEKDAARLDWIQSEYIQVDTFAMPTGGDDADVGWTLKQWHCGERVPRLIHEHFKDDLRAAIDAAMGITGEPK